MKPFVHGWTLSSCVARFLQVSLLVVWVSGTDPTWAQEKSSQATVIVEAMETELERSMKGLHADSFERPYFMAYTLKDTHSLVLSGKYGALDTVDRQQYRQAYAEVRVGDYDFDNYAPIEGESTRRSDLFTSYQAPLDNDPLAIRQTFWLISDGLYKDAMSAYLAKQGSSVFLPEEQTRVPSFAKADAIELIEPTRVFDMDEDGWSEIIREVSREMARSESIVDSNMRITAEHETRYFVNSEGTRLVTEYIIYGVFLYAAARAEDGMMLTNERTFYARRLSELPSRIELQSSASTLIAELEALRVAPVMEPYTGPAILAPAATGVLFHEAIGHRLEGERMHGDEGGQTFKGQTGRDVIPRFLTVLDDPTLETFDGHDLNGFYRYDDEGVEAQRAELIESGTLMGYLLSRSPVARKDRSNGHGRSQGNFKPRARMANLVIQVEDEYRYTQDVLKAMLLEEVRKQGKPYGLYIKDIQGGSTNTSGYGYQAFKGSPRLVYRVDAATGEEVLVRGVEVVGTPLAAISRTVAAGDIDGVFNGYCGAESGYVPVSTIAPAVLLTEIELQRVQGARERDTLLTAPIAVEEN